ncbi:MAG: MFS transporter [Fimbriiglobus sp.]
MSNPSPSSVPEISGVARILVLLVAAIGFLFDTYELLMFPVIGSDALSELLPGRPAPESDPVRLWSGRMLWIAALCGGVFGLLGGWLIDRLGRKTVMVASILAYSVSPLAAAFSTELWQLILFRCTTFIGVCVEMVAAVTWLAELFQDKRTREKVIGWTLACASLGGILVTEVYSEIVAIAKTNPDALPKLPFPEGFDPTNTAWRYTLLTGLIPGALILLMMPFVPESAVWKQKKRDGTLKRASFGELFSPALRRTTLVTTILSACGYAAAFGALQLTPLQIAPGLPDIVALKKEKGYFEVEQKFLKAQADYLAKTGSEDAVKAARGAMMKHPAAQEIREAMKAKRGNIQRWQELGGLSGRILLAVLLMFVPSRMLLRLFVIPGIALFPLTYLELVKGEYFLFATSIFFCGLLTVAQFSYLSELLPKLFPLHLRGTGGSFATNVGGRMLGTMAATFNTEFLSQLFTGPNPMKVATAAAIIGGTVYFLALVSSFFLPTAKEE